MKGSVVIKRTTLLARIEDKKPMLRIGTEMTAGSRCVVHGELSVLKELFNDKREDVEGVAWDGWMQMVFGMEGVPGCMAKALGFLEEPKPRIRRMRSPRRVLKE